MMKRMTVMVRVTRFRDSGVGGLGSVFLNIYAIHFLG